MSNGYRNIATYNTHLHQSEKMLYNSKGILKRTYGFSFLNESMTGNTPIPKVIDIRAVILLHKQTYYPLHILLQKLINKQQSSPSDYLFAWIFRFVLFCFFSYLNVQTREWICNSVLVTEETGCELESQAHFLQKTESGLVKTDSGWCEVATLV